LFKKTDPRQFIIILIFPFAHRPLPTGRRARDLAGKRRCDQNNSFHVNLSNKYFFQKLIGGSDFILQKYSK
jgi:hypothetical protein